MRETLFIILLILPKLATTQSRIDSFRMYDDVRVTLDAPVKIHKGKTVLIIYTLPNGNTTEQTMGKKMEPGHDWHFDIQHIRAQTSFIRSKLRENVVVAYLENQFKSWPLWKQKHDYKKQIPNIVDTLLYITKAHAVYLNGHSGGGSFIFGYLDGIDRIPAFVHRIGFIDSNYGYDSSYYQKFKDWLTENRKSTLTVFAYNDSVALYNGKPVVSARGGTWYRSRMMLGQLQQDFDIAQLRDDSLLVYADKNKRIGFFFKTNPYQKIFHTQQVELNGFIHSILFGTKKENEEYSYFGPRAYNQFIF